MTKREELINPDSTWNKVGPDEPVFIVRAQDATFVAMILYWLILNAHIRPGAVIRYVQKWQYAMACITSGADWQAQNHTKAAD